MPFWLRMLTLLLPITSVIGGSLIAPVANKLPPSKLYPKGTKVFTVNFWRFASLCLIIFPVAFMYILYKCFKHEHKSDETKKDKQGTSPFGVAKATAPAETKYDKCYFWLKVEGITFLSNICLTLTSAGLVGASQYTSTSHAYLLTTQHGVLWLVC